VIHAAMFRETQTFVAQVRQQFQAQGQWNMEALETGLRAALLKDGCAILQGLLNQPGALGKIKPEGRSHGIRPREVQCLLGRFELQRGYYIKPDGQGYCPMDLALGLQDQYTPGAQNVAVYAGAMDGAFEEAEVTLRRLAGLEIPASQVRRLVHKTAPRVRAWTAERQPEKPAPIPTFYVGIDGTGVPMRRSETRGRRGKQPHGDARTREAKLGCIFTRHSLDAKGNPLRDPDATSYLATFADAELLGRRLLKEARRRGLAYALQVAVIGDGARWIWNQARINFPGAIEILDFYHACEHLLVLATALTPAAAEAKQTATRWRRWMEHDHIDKVLAQARSRLPPQAQRRKTANKELAYFALNASRMRYRTFLKMHLFIGSGVVEAGCKTVVGKRTKQSGMLWTVAGAQDVLDTRCCILSGDYDAFWLSTRPKAA
jgi:hypothetical protein